MKYTFEEFSKGIDALVDSINKDKFKYKYIVGIARGGLIPATVLSYRLNIPVITVEWSTRDFGVKSISPDIHDLILCNIVLLVDDIVDSGLTIRQLKQHIGVHKTAALIYNTKQDIICDYYHKAIDRDVDKEWVVFWWDEKEKS
jgi:hypoxanthine phosphoribosyltransferase